jgi:small subunit ribosomal protein S16
MLAIKLSRIGKRHRPHYRIIVLEKSKDPWGDFKENLGTYNPRSKKLDIQAERIKYWISKGAQPTDTIFNILVAEGVIEGKKRRVSRISKKRQAKLDEKAKEAKEKAAPAEAPKEEVVEEKEAPKEETKPEEKKEETPTEDKK